MYGFVVVVQTPHCVVLPIQSFLLSGASAFSDAASAPAIPHVPITQQPNHLVLKTRSSNLSGAWPLSPLPRRRRGNGTANHY